MEIVKKETASLREAVLLNDDDLLVKPIPDYYSIRKSGGFNSHVQEDALYNVGVIVVGGDNIDPSLYDCVIFYRKSVGDTVSMDGEKYCKINKVHHMILIRTDEKVINS